MGHLASSMPRVGASPSQYFFRSKQSPSWVRIWCSCHGRRMDYGDWLRSRVSTGCGRSFCRRLDRFDSGLSLCLSYFRTSWTRSLPSAANRACPCSSSDCSSLQTSDTRQFEHCSWLALSPAACSNRLGCWSIGSDLARPSACSVASSLAVWLGLSDSWWTTVACHTADSSLGSLAILFLSRLEVSPYAVPTPTNDTYPRSASDTARPSSASPTAFHSYLRFPAASSIS